MRTTMKFGCCWTWHGRKEWDVFFLIFRKKGKREILLLSVAIWWKSAEKTKLNSFERHSMGTGASGCRLQYGKFQLGIRKIFFTMKVGQTFEQESREAVKSSSMEIFKAAFGKELSNMIQVSHTLNEEFGQHGLRRFLQSYIISNLLKTNKPFRLHLFFSSEYLELSHIPKWKPDHFIYVSKYKCRSVGGAAPVLKPVLLKSLFVFFFLLRK